MKQTELAKKYTQEMDRMFSERDYFIDFTKCDVCSSTNLHYSQRQNGVVRNCKDCDEYCKWRKSN